MKSSCFSRERTKPSAIDAHVGRRIHSRRLEAGVPLPVLSEAAGVACQQMQKYELGRNRISAGRLFAVSRALGVPVGYFFEGLEQ